MNTARMSAIVPAGGRSSRLPENKLLLPLGQQTVIGNLILMLSGLFAECIIVTDHPEEYVSLPARTASDLLDCPAKNSLTGIHAGLSLSGTPYNLVVAGDMPFVAPGLARRLCTLCDGYDVTVPRQGEHLQPLCAVYHKNCLPEIERRLSEGEFKVTDFFAHVRTQYVDVSELQPYDPELLSFFNVNTPEDYRRAREIFNRGTT